MVDAAKSIQLTASGTIRYDGWICLTPRRAETPEWICAVSAVTALEAWHPRLVIVLISACIPAPPDESEPAMVRTCFISSRSGSTAPQSSERFSENTRFKVIYRKT
jgi:hypothetical protein